MRNPDASDSFRSWTSSTRSVLRVPKIVPNVVIVNIAAGNGQDYSVFHAGVDRGQALFPEFNFGLREEPLLPQPLGARLRPF
jgi:hypothetical protein